MEEDKIVAASTASDSGYSLTLPCDSKPEGSPAPIVSVVIEATELPSTGTAVTEFTVTATAMSKDEEYASSSSEGEVLTLYDDDEETDDEYWVPRGKPAYTVSSGTRAGNDRRRDGSQSGGDSNNSSSKDKKDKDKKDKNKRDKDKRTNGSSSGKKT